MSLLLFFNQQTSVKIPIAGASSGVASVSGLLKGKGHIIGSSNGVGSLLASLKGRGHIIGITAGSTIVIGVVSNHVTILFFELFEATSVISLEALMQSYIEEGIAFKSLLNDPEIQIDSLIENPSIKSTIADGINKNSNLIFYESHL